MKAKPEEKNKRATNHPTQRHWHEMNRKQRRETMRKSRAKTPPGPLPSSPRITAFTGARRAIEKMVLRVSISQFLVRRLNGGWVPPVEIVRTAQFPARNEKEM